ncbi:MULTISPECIES: c-type cytochrome [unclassified Moraxella]|uniref:c-type cytochrome n=1 Tax=unclassified Moraxella TaxID=2685852 RepID=UPI003AF904F6
MIKNSLGMVCAILLPIVGLTACQRPAPTERPSVTLPVYTQGNAEQGKKDYQQHCQKCHKLQLGDNEKGPQLSRIYGAKSALLAEYQYTDALKNSQLTWTADNLDNYIANSKQAVTGTRMRSDPIADPKTRQDIIAYLSTLR